MGILYDMVSEINRAIESQKLDFFETRGRIALKSGVVLSLIRPDTPDDLQKIEKLKIVVREELGISL
jgi:hypothetical protein